MTPNFAGSTPRTMFSVTVSVSTSMKCWCTMPMPRSMAWRGPLISTTFAVDENLPAVGPEQSVRDVHERRLPGAVLAEKRDHLTGVDVE